MIEICKNLFIGSDYDFKKISNNKTFSVIHACKEPYHRLLLGYKGRSCDKNNPEYLYAERDNILYLNLIDANSIDYIPESVINKALSFIDSHIESTKILLHCNLGQSRSAIIGLLYLRKKGYYDGLSCEEGLNEYKKLYILCNPNKGMLDYLKKHWDDYYEFR